MSEAIGEAFTKGRKRASRPKIKTGCTSCKLRRVKCDETRPSCLRCQRAGRICDGYTNEYVRADPTALGPKLDLGWWECTECAREVNSSIWGDVCPDCSHTRTNESDTVQTQTQTSKSEIVFETLQISAEPPGSPSDEIIGTQESLPDRLDSSSPTNHRLEGSPFRWRFCHLVIGIGCFTFIGSLSLALWWSLTRNDVSGGFTMAAYVVAVGGIPLASMQIRHSQRCQCWDRSRRIIVRDRDGG